MKKLVLYTMEKFSVPEHFARGSFLWLLFSFDSVIPKNKDMMKTTRIHCCVEDLILFFNSFSFVLLSVPLFI